MIQRIFWGVIYGLAIFWVCNAQNWSPYLLFIPLLLVCVEFIKMEKLKVWEKIFGIIYVSYASYSTWSISYYSNTDNLSILFIIFGLIWISDSMAFFGGKFFGKNPLAPSISPNKTIEGAVIGFICTLLIGCFSLNFIDPMSEFKSINSWQRISWALPLTISISAPLGDLIGSKFKRLAGVKDSGAFLPGHGGALDRFDSFLLSVILVQVFQSYILIS
jgi:phosphatidate cytidylyltransferase